MHYYQFNIGDYAKKTQHLTNEEDLAYRRLLDLYYDTENPSLTGGLATLSRRLRVSQESLKNVLEEFFPGGINSRADQEIAEYHEYIEKQKANGIKGGRPRSKPTANPPLTQNNPVLSQPLTSEPLTVNQEPLNTKSTPLSGKPDVVAHSNGKEKMSTACMEILDFLNKKTGKHFRPVDANIQPIANRLREGATVIEIRQVIAKKCREWGTDDEMRGFLRPLTLFNKSKFAQYQGELGAQSVSE